MASFNSMLVIFVLSAVFLAVVVMADPSNHYNNNYSPIYSINVDNGHRGKKNKNNLNNLIIRNSYSTSYGQQQQKGYGDNSYGYDDDHEDYGHQEGYGHGGPTHNYNTCIQNLSSHKKNQDVAILALLLGCNGIAGRG